MGMDLGGNGGQIPQRHNISKDDEEKKKKQKPSQDKPEADTEILPHSDTMHGYSGSEDEDKYFSRRFPPPPPVSDR